MVLKQVLMRKMSIIKYE
uniref:Uncharacterized protein n=1 Tax=Rhizophora mucronata TaxID=61149 RepID=A0A2P2QB32_RHIMU